MFKKLKKFLKSFNHKRTVNLREVWGTPEENTEELKRLIVLDFDKIKDRKDPENLFMGRFFSTVLLIEGKLTQMLIGYEPNIEDYTFGRKINVYKDFLKDMSKAGADINLPYHRKFIAPLKEIAEIRNNMAHDLVYVFFKKTDLPQTIGLMKSERRDLYEHEGFMTDESDKCLVLVATFAFQFSSVTAKLVQQLSNPCINRNTQIK